MLKFIALAVLLSSCVNSQSLLAVCVSYCGDAGVRDLVTVSDGVECLCKDKKKGVVK